MARLPKQHRELLAKQGVKVTFGHEVAHFNRKTGELAIATRTIPGEFIHEAGHAIEPYLKLYENSAFQKVLQNGIPEEEIGWMDFALENFGKVQIGYLDHPKVGKFISEYQARSYERDVWGRERFIERDGKEVFNVFTLGEYFAEGYRSFLLEPELLKRKDSMLYQFIKGLIE